ncbi:hypothetical protein PG996_010051 [Apiospora saccharicola]|uniref:Uncharacterized protein n=1 Tax=Apiospora saccharicola TaxID=335842 RepID=A0ABR1UMH5_9PEZI
MQHAVVDLSKSTSTIRCSMGPQRGTSQPGWVRDDFTSPSRDAYAAWPKQSKSPAILFSNRVADEVILPSRDDWIPWELKDIKAFISVSVPLISFKSSSASASNNNNHICTFYHSPASSPSL